MPEISIPDYVETVTDGRDAILDYLRWRKLPAGMDFPWRAPLDHAAKTMQHLDARTVPGPVLRVNPDGGESYLVGWEKLPTGRDSLPLAVPVLGPYGLEKSSRMTDPFAEVVAAAGIAFALAARCAACADADVERGGRARQADNLRTEANALEQLGVHLEDMVRPLGDVFLEQWRAEAVRSATRRGRPIRNSSTPATKPVNLR
jgi:hypothetical protein